MALVVGAVGAGVIIGVRSGGPRAPAACPQFAPMHGLMPLLFRIGVLPKPPVAASIASSDTSTSIVIHPDRNDQIQCGKTPIKTITDVVYAHRSCQMGNQRPSRWTYSFPSPCANGPLWCTFQAADSSWRGRKGPWICGTMS